MWASKDLFIFLNGTSDKFSDSIFGIGKEDVSANCVSLCVSGCCGITELLVHGISLISVAKFS